MAITVDTTNAGRAVTGFKSSSPMGGSMTLGANANMLVVFVAAYQVSGVVSVTYNGTSLTEAVRQTGTDMDIAIFYLANPSTGSSYNISITTSRTIGESAAWGAISFNGASETIGNVGGASGNSSSPTKTISCSANSYLVDILKVVGHSLTLTAGSGQTKFVDVNSGPNFYYTACSRKGAVSAGNNSMSWTVSSANNYALAVLEIKEDVSIPTVTTQDADQIDKTSVRGNGNITATGGANATRRGFCYKAGTSGDPTTSDSVAYDDGDYGTGAFTKSITGLTPGTSYRVRAYAVNSAGTSYGSTIDVKTLSAFIPRTMWFN